MRQLPLNVLAVGAHPDDVELAVGGILALMAGAGDRVVILDLTRGEAGSRGTPGTRRKEAGRAAAILGAADRENLDLGDARLEDSIANRRKVAAAIRKHRPDLILAPHGDDRHPDHAAAGALVRSADALARLAGAGIRRAPFAPGLVLFYPGHRYLPPTFVVDITGVFETRMEAVRAYRSQFSGERDAGGPDPVGFRDYPWQIESRCRHYGSLIGRPYGEGLIAGDPLALPDPGLLLGR